MHSVRKLKGIQDAIWFTTKNPKQSYVQSCRRKVADSDQICVNKRLLKLRNLVFDSQIYVAYQTFEEPSWSRDYDEDLSD